MAIEPQTDRELLLQVNSDVKHIKESFTQAIDHLSETVEKFGNAMENMKREEIAFVQKEITNLKEWQMEIKGAYRLMMIIVPVVSSAFGAGLVYLLKILFAK